MRAAGHGEARGQEAIQDTGALALQLPADLLEMMAAALELLLLLLQGLLNRR